MKTLLLLRHAKSDWAGPDQRDFDRPLNARGRKAARLMGGELRRLGLGADHIVASPASRVVETLTLVADGYGGRMPIAWDRRLYMAREQTLLGIVHTADERHESLLLAGHNPGLHALTLSLAGTGPALAAATAKYPTGALAQIMFEVDCWSAIRPREGRLERFLRPRDLAAEFDGDEE